MQQSLERLPTLEIRAISPTVMQLTASKSNLLVEIQRQNISMSIYDDQISFKYAYTEHSSRHRRSTDEFFDNKNNIAMYIVVPILFLCYGGCAGIYCCYKCRLYIRKNYPVTDIKQKFTKVRNFITGKKEKSRRERFLQELDERPRPLSVQSCQQEEIARVMLDCDDVRSVCSTPGLPYFPEDKQHCRLSSFLNFSEHSPISTLTESTFISYAASVEEHPFEIPTVNPEMLNVPISQKENVVFCALSVGTTTFVKSRPVVTGNYLQNSVRSSKGRRVQLSTDLNSDLELNDKSFEDQQNANDDLSPKVYSTPKPGYADNELKENGALEYQQESTHSTSSIPNSQPESTRHLEIPIDLNMVQSNDIPPPYSSIKRLSYKQSGENVREYPRKIMPGGSRNNMGLVQTSYARDITGRDMLAMYSNTHDVQLTNERDPEFCYDNDAFTREMSSNGLPDNNDHREGSIIYNTGYYAQGSGLSNNNSNTTSWNSSTLSRDLNSSTNLTISDQHSEKLGNHSKKKKLSGKLRTNLGHPNQMSQENAINQTGYDISALDSGISGSEAIKYSPSTHSNYDSPVSSYNGSASLSFIYKANQLLHQKERRNVSPSGLKNESTISQLGKSKFELLAEKHIKMAAAKRQLKRPKDSRIVDYWR